MGVFRPSAAGFLIGGLRLERICMHKHDARRGRMGTIVAWLSLAFIANQTVVCALWRHVAAYKVCDVVSKLVQAHAVVNDGRDDPGGACILSA